LGDEGRQARSATSGSKRVVYVDAIERFVGDLLHAKADSNSRGRVYRSIGKTSFEDDPVNYYVLMGVLDGLKGLGLVGHWKGQTRYRKIYLIRGPAQKSRSFH
jgi:hypothetical protein